MSKKAINMIELCKLAHDRKKNNSTTDFHTKTKNLLSHAYVEYKNLFVDYCKRNGEEYKDKIFYCFQHIFVFLMMCDGELSTKEYDCYKMFCNFAKFEPLTSNDCRALYDRLTVDNLTDDISLLVKLRDAIDPDNYEAMVQGFCYYSITGNKKLHKNQYFILRCFFEGMDTCPSNWTTFQLKGLFGL